MTSRIDLVNYQRQILNKIDAKIANDKQANSVGVLINGDRWLFDIEDIAEVLSPIPKIASVPLCKEWLCGMANIRSHLFSIADLSMFFGHPPVVEHVENCVLIVSPKFNINSGLLVDRSLGLFDTRHWVKDEASCKDDHGFIWRRLHMERLLSDPAFLDVSNLSIK